jgi:2-hydroxychromene-2-carboxylate isomerase
MPELQADWYFDVVSPFAYLQLEQLAECLPIEQLRLRPVVLGALLSHWGTKGPAEIPAKRVQTYRSAQWRAQQLGLPFRMPPAHPFNPIRLLRLALVCDAEYACVREIFRFVWRHGHDASDPAQWAALLERLGRPDAERLIDAPDIKSALREHTDAAIARGVFGVPTLDVHGELFWGEDATAMLARAWHDPQWLRSGEWQRIATLPAGVQRRL